MTEKEKLREHQRLMNCYKLCCELKKLNPNRLQCCDHPLNQLINCVLNDEGRELVECEFDEEIIYNFYVDKMIIEVEFEKATINPDSQKVTIVKHTVAMKRNEETIDKIVKFIQKNNIQLLEGKKQKVKNFQKESEKIGG